MSIKSTPSKVSPPPQSTGQRSAASRSVGQKSAKTNREDKPKGPNRERSIDLQRKQVQKVCMGSYACVEGRDGEKSRYFWEGQHMGYTRANIVNKESMLAK